MAKMANELDERGREICDDTPAAVPVRISRVSEVDRVRYIVREMMSRQAELEGNESFDEADDFDVGDDDFPENPFEPNFEPEVVEGASLSPPPARQPDADASEPAGSESGTDAAPAA